MVAWPDHRRPARLGRRPRPRPARPAPAVVDVALDGRRRSAIAELWLRHGAAGALMGRVARARVAQRRPRDARRATPAAGRDRARPGPRAAGRRQGRQPGRGGRGGGRLGGDGRARSATTTRPVPPTSPGCAALGIDVAAVASCPTSPTGTRAHHRRRRRRELDRRRRRRQRRGRRRTSRSSRPPAPATCCSLQLEVPLGRCRRPPRGARRPRVPASCSTWRRMPRCPPTSSPSPTRWWSTSTRRGCSPSLGAAALAARDLRRRRRRWDGVASPPGARRTRWSTPPVRATRSAAPWPLAADVTARAAGRRARR